MTDLALYESLLSCNTVEELHAKTATITAKMGFEHFLYGVQLQIDSSPPWQFILSGYPEDWVKHYCEFDYQKVDPVLKHCAGTVIPVFWDDLVSLQAAPKLMMNEAKEFGLVSGLTFPLRGFESDFGLFSVSTDSKLKNRKEVSHTYGSIQLLATFLHESVHRIVVSKEIAAMEKLRAEGSRDSTSSSV